MTLKQKLLNIANELAVNNGYTDARAVIEKYAFESRFYSHNSQQLSQIK